MVRASEIGCRNGWDSDFWVRHLLLTPIHVLELYLCQVKEQTSETDDWQFARFFPILEALRLILH